MIASVLSDNTRNLAGNTLEYAKSSNQRAITPHPNYAR